METKQLIHVMIENAVMNPREAFRWVQEARICNYILDQGDMQEVTHAQASQRNSGTHTTRADKTE